MEEAAGNNDQGLTQQKRAVLAMSLLGLVPFVSCTLAVMLLGIENPLSAPAVEIFRNYSVVILSFCGAIRWGHALLREDAEGAAHEAMPIILSIIPAFVAWTTMFMPTQLALGALLVAFCAQGAWDSWSGSSGRLPQWFSSVRIRLTLAVAACHTVLFLLIA